MTARDMATGPSQRQPMLPRAPEPGMVAWRSFLQAHAAIIRRLDAELDAEQAISLADFDVLAQLAGAPDHRLRMSELADRALLSRSGMTRRVDRLETSGMVAREGCASDRRGAFAVLTAAGMRQLREALPTHVRGIDRHFLDLLDANEMACISAVMGRLATRAMGADGVVGSSHDADCAPAEVAHLASSDGRPSRGREVAHLASSDGRPSRGH